MYDTKAIKLNVVAYWSYPVQPYKGNASTLHSLHSALDYLIKLQWDLLTLTCPPCSDWRFTAFMQTSTCIVSPAVSPLQFPLFSVQGLRWNLVQAESTLICSTCSPVSPGPWTNGKKTCAQGPSATEKQIL